VRLQRVAAEREDRIVLEQEELVFSERARGARTGERPLQRPGLPVGDPAQPAGAQEPGRRLLLHDHALHMLTIPAGCARAIRLAHGRAATRAIPGRSIGRGLLDRLENEQARLEVHPVRLSPAAWRRSGFRAHQVIPAALDGVPGRHRIVARRPGVTR